MSKTNTSLDWFEIEIMKKTWPKQQQQREKSYSKAYKTLPAS